MLALLILLSSITGTLLVWKQEYLWLTIPEARADFNSTPEALSRIVARIESQIDPDEILQIQFATSSFALTKVTMLDTRYAYVDSAGNRG